MEFRAHRRKIDPAFTEGELVRVAGGRNQSEAELIQGLLLEWGVPSILRRSAGFEPVQVIGEVPAVMPVVLTLIVKMFGDVN